jgi:hypothetical protein
MTKGDCDGSGQKIAGLNPKRRRLKFGATFWTAFFCDIYLKPLPLQQVHCHLRGPG